MGEAKRGWLLHQTSRPKRYVSLCSDGGYEVRSGISFTRSPHGHRCHTSPRLPPSLVARYCTTRFNDGCQQSGLTYLSNVAAEDRPAEEQGAVPTGHDRDYDEGQRGGPLAAPDSPPLQATAPRPTVGRVDLAREVRPCPDRAGRPWPRKALTGKPTSRQLPVLVRPCFSA